MGMLKRIIYSALFAGALLLLAPNVILKSALKKHGLGEFTSFSIAIPTLSKTSGIALKIYNVKVLAPQVLSESTIGLNSKSITITPIWNSSSTNYNINASDVTLTQNQHELFSKAQIEIHYNKDTTTINASTLFEALFDNNVIEIEAVINDLITGVNGHCLVRLPNVAIKDYNFSFSELMFNFNNKELWWPSQKAAAVNESYIVSDGLFKFYNQKLEFNFNVEDLKTQNFLLTENLIDTTYTGKGHGHFQFKNGSPDYFIDANFESLGGQFLLFNPTALRNNRALVENLLGALKLKKFDQSKIFHFGESLIDLEISNNQFDFKKITLKKENDSLQAKGYYTFDNKYKFKVRYFDDSSPTPLSFSIKGHGDNYETKVDPIDIINAVPDLIIPTLQNLLK